MEYLADGVVSLVNLLRPEAVAIGGGVAAAPEALLLEPLRRMVETESFACHGGRSTPDLAGGAGQRCRHHRARPFWDAYFEWTGAANMEWFEELDQWTASYLPDLEMTAEEPMSRHTSFRIGGPARRMAFPKRPEQVVLLVDFARQCGARPLVIGNRHESALPGPGTGPSCDRFVGRTDGAGGGTGERHHPCCLRRSSGPSCVLCL